VIDFIRKVAFFSSIPFFYHANQTKHAIHLLKEIESPLASNLLVAHSPKLLDFAQLFIIN